MICAFYMLTRCVNGKILDFSACYKHIEPNGSLSSCLVEPLGSKCL